MFFVIIGSIARARGRAALSPARRDQPLGHPVGPRCAEPRFAAAAAAGAVAEAGAVAAAAVRRFLRRRRIVRRRRRIGGMVMLKLSEDDHARVSAAIAAAEAKSDGEIIAIAADQSDAYHDVGAALGGAGAVRWCSPFSPPGRTSSSFGGPADRAGRPSRRCASC